MRSTIKKIKEQNDQVIDSNVLTNCLCQRCGGNGYMKTNPNCYHTCLTCLGRGSVLS